MPPTWSPVGDQACNRGSSPGAEWNPGPFSLRADALSTEPNRPGLTWGFEWRALRRPAWRWLRPGLAWGKRFERRLTWLFTCKGRATFLHTGLWLLRNQPSGQVWPPEPVSRLLERMIRQESVAVERVGTFLLPGAIWVFMTSFSGHTKLSA